MPNTLTIGMTAVNDGAAPAFTMGVAAEHAPLIAPLGIDPDGGPASNVHYSWQRDAGTTGSPYSDIGAPDSDTYTLGADDLGKSVRVHITYTDGQGFSESAFSDGTAAVAAVNDGTGTASIAGIVRENQTLSASVAGDPDGAASGITYQWLRTGVEVAGATGQTYTLGEADVGHPIAVRIAYTDGQGFHELMTSTATGAVESDNARPVLVHPLADVETDEDHFVCFHSSGQMFTDAETATLTYSAALASGDPLPSWIGFIPMPSTPIFSATPPPDQSGPGRSASPPWMRAASAPPTISR